MWEGGVQCAKVLLYCVLRLMCVTLPPVCTQSPSHVFLFPVSKTPAGQWSSCALAVVL